MNHTPQTGYVSYEPKNEMVFVRLEDGKIDLSIYLSNECNSEEALVNAMTAWVEDSDSVIIAPHFTLASPVDYLIDGHKMRHYGNAIDEEARPVFDAVKREMLEQIARIDALKFGKG